MTIIKYVIITFIGLASGIVVSSAVFAFIVALGAVNKTASIMGRADRVQWLEWMVILGASIFNVVYLFIESLLGGYVFIIIMGLFFGIFTGIMAMALAEITRVLPILYMRVNLKKGLVYIVIATVLGKVIGSVFGLCYK
ncbi:MAG: stage V sporulation protein AB [Lachnospiraceae bacterium]|nr:stage V sporulation protein AB [Lachnospiraceae bacterium]